MSPIESTDQQTEQEELDYMLFEYWSQYEEQRRRESKIPFDQADYTLF
jgi:hypothetical protein